MLILAGLGVFVSCTIVDWLYQRWLHVSGAGDALRAAMYSGVLTIVSLSTFMLVIRLNDWLLIPNVLGHAMGSYLGVRFGQKTARQKVMEDPTFAGFFDPAERAREKQASRDADAAALASGEKTPEQLRKENGSFAFPNVRIDFTKKF